MSGCLAQRWQRLRQHIWHRRDEARGLSERIDRAASTMPLFTYQVFILHRQDGLDYATIAALLRLEVDDVEQHIAAALLHLARTLGDED